MKKWLVILTLALLLTGCEQKQETDEKEESPKASVEMSVETSEPEEEAEETEETKETEESKAHTEEVPEATEESTEERTEESVEVPEESTEETEAEETTEAVEESTEPAEESMEVAESEASEETYESGESTELPKDEEKIIYPWDMEELFPNSSEEEIPMELLEGMSIEDLQRARREIYWRRDELGLDVQELNPIEHQNIEKILVVEGPKRLVAPVPTTDLVFFECYATPWDECLGYGIYLYISGGDMYYCYDGNGSYIFGTYYCGGQIKKYTGLSNIKRLKTFNRGTDVNPCPCIITEEGEVYWVDFKWSDGGTEIILERFEFLKDYQVEDVLSYNGEWQHRVELLLKDGSIIYLESEVWG
jgi:hypothetical protein